jgi:hypothetical protein
MNDRTWWNLTRRLRRLDYFLICSIVVSAKIDLNGFFAKEQVLAVAAKYRRERYR